MATFAAGCNQAPEPPLLVNVVFLLADDMRFDAIRAHGNAVVETPNLDRLVAEGVTFTRAIAASPICTPSRAEILTGASGHTNGVTFFGHEIDRGLAVWPDVLRSAGYQTEYVGKWHNDGSPTDWGFDEVAYQVGGISDHEMIDSNLALYRGGGVSDVRGRPSGTGRNLRKYSSALFADAAIRFIRGSSGRPFFLQVSFTAPHDPRTLPPGYEQMYTADHIPLPANFLAQHPFDNGALYERDEGLLERPLRPEDVQRDLAVYYAMISHLDEQVGRILHALEATGKDANTLIIFSSDNGLALGSHGLLGKQNMYDHSIGVPMILRGPGIPQGVRIDAQCYLRDLFPTVVDFLQVRPTPATVEGRSLLPLLGGAQASLYPYLYGYYSTSQRMIREERWKLIHYPNLDKYQLFDLSSDPDELHDLAGDSSYAHTLARLRAILPEQE